MWQALGDVANYVEPFFGSGAVLLGRPYWHPGVQWIETVNDLNGMVSNFWRALQMEPDAVSAWADWPSNENDLHARHAWLVGHKVSLQSLLEGNPDYYDAKIAGWWVWGMANWIGGGFCSGEGPWQVCDGQLVRLGNTGQGIKRQLVHLSAGQGIQRKRVHLGDAGLGYAGTGEQGLLAWMHALAERLRRVRVCCGDWSRACGLTPTIQQGLTGVFLDPPYSAEAGRDPAIYAHEDLSVAHDVRRWCQEWGSHPLIRIILCGYAGEGHEVLEADGWCCVPWKTGGGYRNLGSGPGLENAARERLWLSKHCLPVETQLSLFNS